MDEALALPSEKAATLALRTQQVILHETGVVNTVDPLGGSYFVEALTKETEDEAYGTSARSTTMGGVIPAIESGFFHREIMEASARFQSEVDDRQRVIVGVNDYVMDEPIQIPILEMDPQGEERQVARLSELRRTRDNRETARTLRGLEQSCRNGDNVMPHLLDAVNAYATLQEMCDVMRDAFGVYQEDATSKARPQARHAPALS